MKELRTATVDTTTIGAAYLAEAEKAGHRALALAVILVLAHLLDIQPSEAEGMGLKVAIKDPAVVYGGIALLFGYYASRWISHSETSQSLLSLSVQPKRIRANLRLARRMYLSDKKQRKTPQTPQSLKKSARSYIKFGNVVLLPYIIISVLFIIAALVFMAVDLYNLADLIWSRSPILRDLSNFIRDAWASLVDYYNGG